MWIGALELNGDLFLREKDKPQSKGFFFFFLLSATKCAGEAGSSLTQMLITRALGALPLWMPCPHLLLPPYSGVTQVLNLGATIHFPFFTVSTCFVPNATLVSFECSELYIKKIILYIFCNFLFCLTLMFS